MEHGKNRPIQQLFINFFKDVPLASNPLGHLMRFHGFDIYVASSFLTDPPMSKVIKTQRA